MLEKSPAIYELFKLIKSQPNKSYKFLCEKKNRFERNRKANFEIFEFIKRS